MDEYYLFCPLSFQDHLEKLLINGNFETLTSAHYSLQSLIALRPSKIFNLYLRRYFSFKYLPVLALGQEIKIEIYLMLCHIDLLVLLGLGLDQIQDLK